MRKLFNFRPIVFSGCSIVLGVLFAAAFARFGVAYALIPICFGAVGAAVWYFLTKDGKILLFCTVALALFSVGALRTGIRINENLLREPTGEVVTFSGKVAAVYSGDGGAKRAHLKDVKSDVGSVNGSNVICVVYGDVEVGESYVVSSKLKKISFTTVDLFYFPLDVSYVSSGGFSSEKTGEVSGFFGALRKKIKGVLKEGLDGEPYAFMSAVMLGDVNDLDAEAYSNLRSAGVAHVFAVSGLHIGFFAVIVTFLLSLVGVRRFKKDIIVLIFTLIYSGICGFAVSTIRAVIMCFVFGLANSFGKKRDVLNAVFLSLTVVLVIFPQSLFSYGFLLSFSAATGIALLSATFKNLFSFMSEGLKNAFAVSLAAFISTAPIVAVIMKSVSLITVLMNVIVIPIVVFLFYYTFTCVIITLIIPHFNFVFVITNALVSFVYRAIRLVEFDNFLIRGVMTGFNIALYYISLVLASEKINIDQRIKRVLSVMPAASLILFV